MSLAEQTKSSFRPDVTTPSTPIRLPGIPGEVLWQAKLDLTNTYLKVLEMKHPNGIVDTVTFDQEKGVSVLRKMGDESIHLTPSMTRQALIHARIISGLHLQIAIEKVLNHVH